MMAAIDTEHPFAVAVVEAIHSGDIAALRQLLDENPGLAATRFGDDDPDGMSRSLLHVATDWPGHFPNGATTVAVLSEAGADVNTRFRGPHAETPLHWAASSNDVAVLDALIDAGADIEAPGAVIGGGTHSPTRRRSHNGTRHIGWSNEEQGRRLSKPRHSACWTVSRATSSGRHRLLRRRSTEPSGVCVTVDSEPAPSICSIVGQTSTGYPHGRG